MESISVFAFWQLGSGWMLLWGLAAALPILIHLWSRRRYQEVTWAAMEFVLAAMRKNSRRIQLEQWLLLAVRTLLVVLFSLALANPSLSLISSLTSPGGGQTHVVLVIDGSYSMDFRQGETSRFDAAKELARKFVADGQQGNGYTLVLMGEPPRTIISEPAFDPQDVQEEIANLQLPHAGANLPATLAEVESILRQGERNQPRLAQKRVIILSDLGRTTWADANSAECRERLGRIGGLASISLLDLGSSGEQNLAVTRLETDQPLSTLAAETTFRAEVRSFASQDMPGQNMEFLVDGVRVAEQTLDVSAGGRASAAFSYRFETPGEHLVEVRLANDALPIDNRRFLSIPVREAIRVLCIYGRPKETRHLALALEPRRDNRPRIKVEQAAETALGEFDLKTYDCIFLCNIGRFSRDEADVLRQYLQAGGGLVFFLGDQVQPENYNQELGGADAGKRVLPATLLQPMPDGQYRFDPLEYRHPIIAPFRGFESSGLLTTPIWKYIQLQPNEGAQTALAFSGNDPAIVEQKLFRGRSILFASAASSEAGSADAAAPAPWTAISSWPSFTPLVQEMLELAVARRDEGRNLQVGEELVGTVTEVPPETPLTIVTPDGRNERLSLSHLGEQLEWTYLGGNLSGAYEARLGSPVKSLQKYALNVDTRESDLERSAIDSLPSQISLELSTDEAGKPALSAIAETSYFRELLFAVLLLLACEMSLAWYMGRGMA